MLEPALKLIIDVVFGILTYTLLLRFVMQVLRAPFRNPAGQAVIALTDWIVKPLRKILPGFKGIDWASLVATYLFQVLWLFAYYFAFGSVFSPAGGGVYIVAIIELIRAALWLLIIVVFLQAILSWFAPDGPLAGLLNALTFPFLRPVRRIVPPIGGTLDLSPLIVIVLAQLALLLPVTWLESTLTRAFI